jgi:hypothetical protein
MTARPKARMPYSLLGTATPCMLNAAPCPQHGKARLPLLHFTSYAAVPCNAAGSFFNRLLR